LMWRCSCPTAPPAPRPRRGAKGSPAARPEGELARQRSSHDDASPAAAGGDYIPIGKISTDDFQHLQKNMVQEVQRSADGEGGATAAIAGERARVAAALDEFHSRFQIPAQPPVNPNTPVDDLFGMKEHERPVLDPYELLEVAQSERVQFADVISVIVSAVDKQSVPGTGDISCIVTHITESHVCMPAARVLMQNRAFHAALRAAGKERESTFLNVMADAFDAFDKSHLR
jgi:hypothetical protein